ncbi:MAG: flagellar biosynthesis protein FlhA, partial [Candidatus Zixiibacteriota bacterium]
LPGMPTLTFVTLGAVVGGVGYVTHEVHRRKTQEAVESVKRKASQQAQEQERTEDLLKVDILGVEIGYGLIPLVDPNQGGDLLNRIATMRKQLASELGIIVPPVRIRDNVQLTPNQYQVKVKGIRVAGWELMMDHLMAINPGYIEDKLDGFDTREPAFSLKATWIIPGLREVAEAKGFTVVEPSAVLVTHLTEVIRTAAPEILSRQDVQHLVTTLKEDYPALVDAVIPDVIPLGTLQKVLQSLLKERVPIRDLATIVETISDYIGATKEPDVLSEYVRMDLKRQITEMYRDKEGQIHVFTIDPALEQTMAESIQNTKQGLVLAIEPSLAEALLNGMGEQISSMETAGRKPLCLCSPNIRLVLRRLAETRYPDLVVVSYNELLPDAEVVSVGMVKVQDDH